MYGSMKHGLWINMKYVWSMCGFVICLYEYAMKYVCWSMYGLIWSICVEWSMYWTRVMCLYFVECCIWYVTWRIAYYIVIYVTIIEDCWTVGYMSLVTARYGLSFNCERLIYVWSMCGFVYGWLYPCNEVCMLKYV